MSPCTHFDGVTLCQRPAHPHGVGAVLVSPRKGGAPGIVWAMSETVGEAARMNDDYAKGRRDGLRLALAILAAEEAKWSALLGESQSWRTNATREVRHKTLQVAQSRVRTALNRLTPKDAGPMDPELAAALDLAGL